MRNTKQKNLILSIINNSYSHPTGYEIYEISKKTIPSISLGTVYRNLNNLVDDGKIKRIKMGNNIDRFDRVENPHIHFICLRCHKVIDLEQIEQKEKEINGNQVIDYEINYRGICKECRKEGLNGIKGK